MLGEPSVVARRIDGRHIPAVGNEAKQMIGRTAVHDISAASSGGVRSRVIFSRGGFRK